MFAQSINKTEGVGTETAKLRTLRKEFPPASSTIPRSRLDEVDAESA
jgi:hypothetical protein